MGYLARDVAVVLGLAAGAYFANSWSASTLIIYQILVAFRRICLH